MTTATECRRGDRQLSPGAMAQHLACVVHLYQPPGTERSENMGCEFCRFVGAPESPGERLLDSPMERHPEPLRCYNATYCTSVDRPPQQKSTASSFSPNSAMAQPIEPSWQIDEWFIVKSQAVENGSTKGTYHFASRPGHSSEHPDAGYSIAFYIADSGMLTRDGQKRVYLVVCRQFRPTVQAEALEFPAGLRDVGSKETGVNCALREFIEETPFTYRPLQIDGEISGIMGYSSLGLTDENVTGVFFEASTKNDQVRFEARDDESYRVVGDTMQDDGEKVETFVVPLDKFSAFVKSCEGRGEKIDVRITNFALTMQALQLLNERFDSTNATAIVGAK